MSADSEVVVVPTGTANLASVLVGLRRAGAEPRVSEDAGKIERAARVVLPGVGTLAAAVEWLRAAELVDPLRRRVVDGRPTKAIGRLRRRPAESSFFRPHSNTSASTRCPPTRNPRVTRHRRPSAPAIR